MTPAEEKNGDSGDMQVVHIEPVSKQYADAEKDIEMIENGSSALDDIEKNVDSIEDAEITFKTKLAIFVRVTFFKRSKHH